MDAIHKATSALFICLITLTLSSTAATVRETSGVSETSGNSEFRLATGYLTGESGEYVYDAYGLATGIPGYKMSQLNWQIDTLFMAGIGTTLHPFKNLRFNADYWRNVGNGGGVMDDYDWMYVGLDWSHWSHSPNTTVTNVDKLNINGELTYLQLDDAQTELTLLAGFRRDHFKWVAVGGYGIYSISSYRDSVVVFPDTPGITYEQEYSTPYLGLGLHSSSESDGLPITLNANILYSQWVHGNDKDTHHYRDLYFTESGNNGKWLAFSLSLDFYLTQQMALTFAYDTQSYSEIKASSTMTDLSTGAVYSFPGPAGGLDNTSSTLSAQLTYQF